MELADPGLITEWNFITNIILIIVMVVVKVVVALIVLGVVVLEDVVVVLVAVVVVLVAVVVVIVAIVRLPEHFQSPGSDIKKQIWSAEFYGETLSQP